jgi:4-amino-4-deoxy-L-arabinose transferase-like glycosyltransferase
LQTPPRFLAAAIALTLLAAALRFIGLADFPPGFFRDEWEKGYTAYELWHTGRHGVLGAEGVRVTGLFPSFIEVFEGHDRTSAIYQYVAAPFVGLLGLDIFTTRLPAALAGLASVFCAGLLARRWFGNAGALIVLAALSTSPVHVLFSTWAQQGIFSLLFAVAGLLLLEIGRGAEAHRRALLVAGGFSLALGAYSYDPARLTLPLVFAAWAILLAGRDGWRTWGPPAVAFTVLWLPLLIFTLGAGSARLQRVGIEFSLQSIPLLLRNYFAHFSPDFILGAGDANPRHAIPLNGLVGRVAFLLAAGALLLHRRTSDRRPIAFLVAWAATAPIAAALTNEGPHALRAALLILPVTLLAGALATSLNLDQRPKLLALIVVAILAVDGGTTAYGRFTQPPSAEWASSDLALMREMLAASDGPTSIDSAIPYAPYLVLFAERTDPADWQARGLAALRTKIQPLGVFPPSNFLYHLAPPIRTLPIEYLSDSSVLYRGDGAVIRAR